MANVCLPYVNSACLVYANTFDLGPYDFATGVIFTH